MGENAEGAAGGKETGRLLNGRYRLGDVLGRGGMGTVWRARDEVLGRTVAVKELRFPSDIDEEEKRRLVTRTLREAKAIARIRSGSAITVFDVVDEDGRPWIVMELVEGRSLADDIREDGPLTPRRAAEVGLAILNVLRAAHREGIVHRDVKPSNVLIEEETGRVVLTDFGIAKVEGDPSVTSTGMLVGAPSYISPERARGQLPGPPADMWSLGALLYASVEGHPPYDKGSAIATLTAVMTDPLEPPTRAGALEEAIYGLLLKDPEKRLDDAGARVLLESVLDVPEESEKVEVPAATATVVLPEESPGGDETGVAASSGNGTRRPPLGVIIAAVVVVLLGVLGAVLAFAMGDGDNGGSSGKDDNAAVTDGSRGDGGGDAKEEKGEKGAKEEKEKKEAKEGESGGEGGDKGADSRGKAGLPEGYRSLTDDQFRFSMAMPDGWKRIGTAGLNSGGKYSAGKGSLPQLQVDFSDSPKDDALRAWQLLESAVRGASTDYKQLSMKSVEWRDYPTVADWHFERKEHGERVHVLNRGFKVDDKHGYAIVVTCEVDEWDGEQCRTLRETAFETFQPAD
ncbi:serine/threonine-protein kinase [Streptomyces gobiensis]|uniref:serine/threonine-protein kinase n=1 Tax=Streptomyces gobiensis TaxID=2875706 RepID=UPI001E60A554|nr:serine/threonine-protein kinase [Streptomyces gobiensis]UGY93173.1 serine/threonine protein kinase [Streptomyces gobiensis]